MSRKSERGCLSWVVQPQREKGERDLEEEKNRESDFRMFSAAIENIEERESDKSLTSGPRMG